MKRAVPIFLAILLCAGVLLSRRSRAPAPAEPAPPVSAEAPPASALRSRQSREPYRRNQTGELRLTVSRSESGARLVHDTCDVGAGRGVWEVADTSGLGGWFARELRTPPAREAIRRLEGWSGVGAADAGRALAWVSPWLAAGVVHWPDPSLTEAMERSHPGHPATELLLAHEASQVFLKPWDGKDLERVFGERKAELFDTLRRIEDPALARWGLGLFCGIGVALPDEERALLEWALDGADAERPDLVALLVEQAFLGGDEAAYERWLERLDRALATAPVDARRDIMARQVQDAAGAERVAAGRREPRSWREALMGAAHACALPEGAYGLRVEGGAWHSEEPPSLALACALEHAARGPAPPEGERVRLRVWVQK